MKIATMEETAGHWNAATVSMREYALQTVHLAHQLEYAGVPWEVLPDDVREILTANLYTGG